MEKKRFYAGQKFEMGGREWTIFNTGADWAKCIASKCIENDEDTDGRAFDLMNYSNFSKASINDYLNCDFAKVLLEKGAPWKAVKMFEMDLTTDDGLKNYGTTDVCIGLITCEEYRKFREYIPPVDCHYWTCTADSINASWVRIVKQDGTFGSTYACNDRIRARPVCKLNSEILAAYLNGENANKC